MLQDKGGIQFFSGFLMVFRDIMKLDLFFDFIMLIRYGFWQRLYDLNGDRRKFEKNIRFLF